MAAAISHLDGRIVFVSFSSRRVALGLHAVQSLHHRDPLSSSSPSSSSCASAAAVATCFTDSDGNFTLPPARAAPRIRRPRLAAPPEHLPGSLGLPSETARTPGTPLLSQQGPRPTVLSRAPPAEAVHGGPFSGTYRGVIWNAQGLFMARAPGQGSRCWPSSGSSRTATS